MPVLTLSPEDEYSYRAAMPMLLADRYDHKLTAKERKENRKLYRYCLRQYKREITEQAQLHLGTLNPDERESRWVMKTVLQISFCLIILELASVAHVFMVPRLELVVEDGMNSISELLEKIETGNDG
jgi:hypothetical protein